jgi:Vitamin K-dependent gamma-carboxylase
VSKLEGFFFAPLRFRGLYVMRAVFGLIALFYYLRLLPNVQVFFGPSGVGGYRTAARWPTFPIGITEGFEHFDVLRHVASPGLVWALYGALLCAGLLFAVGLATRPMGLALAALHVAFAARQPYLTMGWAQLYPVFVVYLALAPSGQAWSVDAWLARRKDPTSQPPEVFSPWALRLLQVHVIAMYAMAGWPRFAAGAWLHGETVLHAAADTRFGRWGLDWHALQPLLVVATYYALLIEPAATLLLPLRVTRRWCALGLLALHLGIELVADVGMWQFMMAGALCAFLPDQWFRWVPGLRNRVAAGGADW